jgi:hypothetical protein
MGAFNSFSSMATSLLERIPENDNFFNGREVVS